MGVSRSRLVEIALVAGLVLVLEVSVFSGYFSGATSPEFDFFGAYNTEAYAWWADGGLFDPPQWMPYLWGGYPAAVNLQNSSFYLPVGITAAIVPYTIHAAAVLSALHVAFGAVGMYVFTRRWGAGMPASLVGLAGWFFAVGFYTNASQLDITRGYAWLPWILIVTSASWSWRRWYGVVVAVVVLWQSFVGIYPGMIIALAYLLPVWIVANQLIHRPRLLRYLVPLVVAGVLAIAMSLVHYLPGLLERGDPEAVAYSDSSYFDLATLGTVLFPFDNPFVLSFEVMRSFFVPALFVALFVFVPWRLGITRALGTVGLLAAILGLPFLPWHELLAHVLPGMMLSRFRMSDYKLAMVFVVVALGVFALQRLLDARTKPAPAWRPIVLFAVLSLIYLFGFVGIRYEFDPARSVPQWIGLLLASALAFGMYRGWVRWRTVVVVPLALALVIGAGLLSVYGSTEEWSTSRERAEHRYFGDPVDSLIAERADRVTLAQRPQRVSVPDTLDDPDFIYWNYGAAFYSGELSVFGYVNLRGTESWDTIKKGIYARGQDGKDAAFFWGAAGVVLEGGASTMPAGPAVYACAQTGHCGDDLTTTPLAYDPKGSFSYEVDASTDVDVMLNEAFYEGWHATLCSVDDASDCTAVATARGDIGQLTLAVPKGDWRLELQYRLPGFDLTWALLWVSVVATGLWAAFIGLHARRRARKGVVLAPYSQR